MEKTVELARKAQDRTYPGFEKENGGMWSGPFFFVQGADCQFGMTEMYSGRNPNPTWDVEIELVRKAMETINSMVPKPKFFIICGDLFHPMPGAEYREAQEKDFLKVFSEMPSDVPLVCVCGNHDVGDTPSPESIQSYRDKFGDDYFTFYTGGVMFIVLNSQFFEDSSMVEDLAKEQEIWLDKQLAEAKSGKYKHVIVFQHIPWFIQNADEEKEYFNIFPDLRQKMLNKFCDANIRAIFCGHLHRNAGGFYKDLEIITTSAIGYQLGTDKSGFRIVTLKEDQIEHHYLAFEDAPKNIEII